MVTVQEISISDDVLVIVGDWECRDQGVWHFVVCNDVFAKCIDMRSDDSFEVVHQKIVNEFGVDLQIHHLVITFWVEGGSQVFTQIKMPPVAVDGDAGLAQFKKKRQEQRELNLFVSMKKNEEGSLMKKVRAGEALLEDDRGGQGNSIGDEGFTDIPVLFDDVAFSPVVDNIPNVDNIGTQAVCMGKRRREVLQLSGCMSQTQTHDYDIDAISALIDREYPIDWDPLNPTNCPSTSHDASMWSLVDDNSGGHLTETTVHQVGFGDWLLDSFENSDPCLQGNVQEANMEDISRSCPQLPGQQLQEDSLNTTATPLRSVLCFVEPCMGNSTDSSGHGCGPQIPTSPTTDGHQRDEGVWVANNAGDYPTVVEESPLLLKDSRPFRDNAAGLAKDKTNMNLRRAGNNIYVGRVFKDKSDLHKALSAYSMKRLYNFKITYSAKKKVVAVCEDPNCHWRIYATNHKGSDNLEIRTATLNHTCDAGSRSQRGKKATTTLLGELIQAKYAYGKFGPRACELPEILLSELKVSISYMEAWYAKEVAMNMARGSEEDSYKSLAIHLHLVETTNPGTITNIHTTMTADGKKLFKYLFFSFGASVAGYKHLRKVVVIDGTYTRGKYKSCLVAASGQDGNYQIFPLAFGVVDSENTIAWSWFFENLKKVVPDEEDLVFVSDRHAAIYAGLKAQYPRAHHVACAVHLFRNVVTQFKCEGLAGMVSNAARAYTVGDFRYWWEEIQKREPKCIPYLMKIGLPHWTLAFFSGMRYNLMSSNISESLNYALQKAMTYLIVAMVEFIRTTLMRWFCEKRAEAWKTKTRCPPEIEELLIEHMKEATDCAVVASNDWIYQVNDGEGMMFTVDLKKKKCTCRVFDVLMVPCCHALAAVGIRNVDMYTLIGDCFRTHTWRELWGETVLPPQNERDNNVPSSVGGKDTGPPKTRRGGGRPRSIRIPSQGEFNRKGGKKGKYTTCGKVGHNRATCKNPI